MFGYDARHCPGEKRNVLSREFRDGRDETPKRRCRAVNRRRLAAVFTWVEERGVSRPETRGRVKQQSGGAGSSGVEMRTRRRSN